MGTITPFSRKLNYKKIKQLAQGNKASKWWRRNLSLDCLLTEPTFLTIRLSILVIIQQVGSTVMGLIQGRKCIHLLHSQPVSRERKMLLSDRPEFQARLLWVMKTWTSDLTSKLQFLHLENENDNIYLRESSQGFVHAANNLFSGFIKCQALC